jgi:exosortase
MRNILNLRAKTIPNILLSFFLLAGITIYLTDIFTILIKSWMLSGIGGAWQFFIIPVSIYMIWHKRKELSFNGNKNYWVSYIFAIFAFGFYLIGKLLLIDFALEISLLFFITGSIVAIFGFSFLPSIFWPLVYLVLMTSIINRIIDHLLYFLQLSSAIISHHLLNMIGFTSLRHLNYLKIPGMVLEVADVCSGANQLIALTSFAIPIVYFLIKHNLIRFFALAMVLPLTILFNSIRIVLIAIWNYNQEQTYIHGPKDILLIPIIMPLTLIAFYLVTLLISRLFEKSKNTSSQKNVTKDQFSLTQIKKRIIVFSLLIATPVLSDIVLTELKKPMVTFAIHKSEMWNSISTTNTPEISYKYGKPDIKIDSTYINNEGDTLFLHIGYFKKQTNNNRVLGNSIDITDTFYKKDIIQFIDKAGNSCNANFYLLNKDVVKDGNSYFNDCILYWYKNNGKPSLSAGDFRKKYFKDKISLTGTNGTFIAIEIRSNNIDKEKVLSLLKSISIE